MDTEVAMVIRQPAPLNVRFTPDAFDDAPGHRIKLDIPGIGLVTGEDCPIITGATVVEDGRAVELQVSAPVKLALFLLPLEGVSWS